MMDYSEPLEDFRDIWGQGFDAGLAYSKYAPEKAVTPDVGSARDQRDKELQALGMATEMLQARDREIVGMRAELDEANRYIKRLHDKYKVEGVWKVRARHVSDLIAGVQKNLSRSDAATRSHSLALLAETVAREVEEWDTDA